MARKSIQLLDDIAQAIAAIRTDTAGMSFDDFLSDGAIQRSVIYSLGIVGEAVRLLLVACPDLANKRPEVPWRQAVGFRNRVFHAYWAASCGRSRLTWTRWHKSWRSSGVPIWIDGEDVRFYEPRKTRLSCEEAVRLLQQNADSIRSYGVRSIGVAGSVARDVADVGSDLDIVADMDLSESPADRYFGLIAFLEDLVHCEIDLLTRDRIKEHVRPTIEADEIRVF